MKAPKDHYIIQIEVTNACIHHCSNCTRLCGHHKKPFFMEYETFCKAVDSVLDHPGLIGVMGGEPTLHPRFADICQYLYKKLPEKKLQDPSAFTLPTDSFIDVRRRRELDEFEIHEYEDGPRPIIMGAGLWTTMTPVYMKNFELIQDVFRYQSLNDHSNASYHQPVLISRKDMGICDDQWIKLREKCWVNQQWSSSITPKGCFFCEVAAAMDMLYDGPGGLPIEKGWWERDIEDFKEQFRWCELCGIPLKTFGRDAREGIVDVSAENAALLQEKKTARYIPERLNIVQIKDGVITEESKKAADAYHGISYINDAQERVSNTTPIYAGNFTGVLNYYEKLIKTANSLKKQADVVCASGHIKEGKQSRILYSFHGESGLLENYDSSELMCRVCKATRKDDANLGAPWDKMYRKAFLKNIAVCFEGRAWEDIRFNMVVFTNNPCVAVSDVIGYHYRTVETSIVNNYNSDKPEINYEFIKWLWEYLKLNISDGTKKGKFIAIIQMRAYMAFMNSLKCYYFHSLNHAPYKEIVRQVKKMKALPIYSDMIKRDSRFSYLTVKQNIFRYVLRLPWLFPAKALYALNEKVRLVTEESGKFVRKGG